MKRKINRKCISQFGENKIDIGEHRKNNPNGYYYQTVEKGKIYNLDESRKIRLKLSAMTSHSYPICIHNKEKEQYEFYEMVESNCGMTLDGDNVVDYDDVLSWIVEKNNQPKLYRKITMKLSRDGNIYSDSSLRYLQNESKSINKDYENFTYSDDFLNLLNLYKSNIQKWRNIITDENNIGKPYNKVLQPLKDYFLNDFFKRTVFHNTMKWTLNLSIYDFINKETLTGLFYCLYEWLNKKIGFYGLEIYGYNKDNANWNVKLANQFNLILERIEYLIELILEKVYITDDEKEFYNNLENALFSGVDIQILKIGD